MTTTTDAMHRLESDIADEALDHLTMGHRLPGRAEWPPEQLELGDDDPSDPLVLMLDGDLVEVEIEVRVIRWRPPGWSKAPQFAKGDVVMVSGPSADRWLVREVLGDQTDPRPGYVLDFVTSLDPLNYRDSGRIALPDEVFAPITEPSTGGAQ